MHRVVIIGEQRSAGSASGHVRGLRPAQRGETVSVCGETMSIFCSGLGPVTNQPSSGGALRGGSNTIVVPTANIAGVAATVSSAQVLPGLAGVYQMQIVVPSTAAVVGNVPVSVEIGGVVSNRVTIAIK